MYTVLKCQNQQVIFSGDVGSGFTDDLLIKQIGFLCRREVMMRKLGRIIYTSKILQPSVPSHTSTSSLINFILDLQDRKNKKVKFIK